MDQIDIEACIKGLSTTAIEEKLVSILYEYSPPFLTARKRAAEFNRSLTSIWTMSLHSVQKPFWFDINIHLLSLFEKESR